jgi:hypothetical protein
VSDAPDPDQIDSAVTEMARAIYPLAQLLMGPRIRAVLERNESLVRQDEAALDHLTAQLLDAIVPPV